MAPIHTCALVHLRVSVYCSARNMMVTCMAMPQHPMRCHGRALALTLVLALTTPTARAWLLISRLEC